MGPAQYRFLGTDDNQAPYASQGTGKRGGGTPFSSRGGRR